MALNGSIIKKKFNIYYANTNSNSFDLFSFYDCIDFMSLEHQQTINLKSNFGRSLDICFKNDIRFYISMVYFFPFKGRILTHGGYKTIEFQE